MSCVLYDSADICNKDCKSCTIEGENYDKFKLYKYEELPYPRSKMQFGDYGTATFCCPACHRLKVFPLLHVPQELKSNNMVRNCKECKYCKEEYTNDRSE